AAPNRANGATQLPAHDREAERSALGSMLRNNSVIPEVVNIVRAEHFYVFAHQKIFEGITALVGRGYPVDAVLMANYLKDKHLVEDIGGYAYLTELWDAAPSIANAKYYAQIVREHAERREFNGYLEELVS